MRLRCALVPASTLGALLVGCAVAALPAGTANFPSDAAEVDSPIADAVAPTLSDGSSDTGVTVPGDTLSDNRDRLLATYFAYLKVFASAPQSNGLSSSNVMNICDVWTKLDPSSQGVFLTLTARLQGSTLGSNGSSMLSHVTKIYRIAGGQNASPSSPGSCGGGEYNRMIMSMDAALHDAQVAANNHQGARQSSGTFDIADAPTGTFWRNSKDLGGPHSPFDVSDETDQGAPRGQTQYFTDPTSAVATSPLGRQDLSTLVDSYSLEMDQDYDCVHNSNPACSYTTYGPLCAPEASELGTQVYTTSYGDFAPSWSPASCP